VSSTPSPESSLVRALGVRQLAAGIVNTTVGAGIFVLPGAVAAGLGAAAPAAYLACAGLMALVVTSFALAGSRVSLTGGLYAYVETAFGPYVGFLAGVLQWLMLWMTAASLLSAFADQLGILVPGTGAGLPRVAVILATVAVLAAVNVRGVTPRKTPVPSGTLGVRSPSRYGNRSRPSAPGFAFAASAAYCSCVQPKS